MLMSHTFFAKFWIFKVSLLRDYLVLVYTKTVDSVESAL